MREDRLYDIQPFPSVRRIPQRQLEPGEQYRFHFDMTKCIGCKCCVVACNEQNGNPAEINWRRVGEVEGGYYPHTQRHLSLDGLQPLPGAFVPDRLSGRSLYQRSRHRRRACTAPTPASAASIAPGIVLTACRNTTLSAAWSANATCATTVWRRHGPACVEACPEGAIAIEIVNIAAMAQRLLSERQRAGIAFRGRQHLDHAHHPAGQFAPGHRPADTQRVEPEHPHWPLVFMLVLTQLSVGAFAVLWLLELLGKSRRGLGLPRWAL